MKLKCRMLLAALMCVAYQMHALSVCIVIDSSGIHEFSAIEAFPTDPNDCAISIETSDVVVRFGNEFISQSPTTPLPGFTGIRIASGVSNITIENVGIKFLTGSGIEVGEGVTNIVVNNVNINDCDAGGIVFAGSTSDRIVNGEITGCLITSCTGANGSPAYGIRLIECDNINIVNSVFNKNDAGTVNTGFGVSLEHCNACKVVGCNGNNNGGNSLGAGISLYQGQWNVIENCKILNTIARAGGTAKASGILIDQSLHGIVRECTVKHSNNLLAEAYGFEACNGTNNLFEGCITKNNSAATQAAGFYLHGSELRTGLVKNRSRSNDGGVAGAGYGILLDGAQTCDIWANQCLGNTGATGIGLRDSVVDTTNLIAKNRVFANQTQGFDVTRVSGTFPIVTVQVGDFTPTLTVNLLYNIEFVTGP